MQSHQQAVPGSGASARRIEPDAMLQGQLADDHPSLMRQISELQRSNIDLTRRYNWAIQLATTMALQPRKWWLKGVPLWVWRRWQLRQLKQKELFDAEMYLTRYPDVAMRHHDPLVDFLRRGLSQGRSGIPAFTAPLPPSAELIDQVLRSGLFDHRWYCAEYGQSLSAEAAVANYLYKSHLEPLVNPGPLFSGAYYLIRNPQILTSSPLIHYIENGMKQGLSGLSPTVSDDFMVSAADETLMPVLSFIDPVKECIILSWSEGNFFFSDIAQYVQEFLQRLGLKSTLASEDGSFSQESYNFIVVAPHEYCIHGPGAKWSQERLARAIYVNTEQWHTSWFSLALGIMNQSRMALDINPASARGLSKLGIRAGFLPLLPFDGGIFSFPAGDVDQQVGARRVIRQLPHSSDFADRPYDIVFVGGLNERRGEVLAKLAPCLAQYDCFIHSPQLRGPVNHRNVNMIASADVAKLAKNAKIFLNIHQGESKYFEWHRLFLSGICEGCVVVTEPCVDTGILVAGIHYLEATPAAMGDLLDWLLQTPDGRHALADVRAHCQDLLANWQYDCE